MRGFVKALALLVPPLRRLYEERNRYAAEVAAFLKENERLRMKFLGTLKMETENLRSQIERFENDIRFRLEDIRRENFSIATSKAVLNSRFQLITDFPIAVESHDHLYPRGTRNDNTRYPRFVQAAERALGKKLKVMDLGCAGGGLVLDFLLAGHEAIGVEGSNYSAIWRRAEWGTIPDSLFNADITKPFSIVLDGKFQKFDLITAWEVLEHIPEDALDGLFDNIRRHLAPNGVFCGSVATFEDYDSVTGAIWHRTVEPREWWVKKIVNAGFEIVEGLFQTADFPRGSGNPRAIDWDASKEPSLGFHICFRLKQ